MTNELTQLFLRDLNKLKDELNTYQKESNLWIVADGINNSSGNLALHLIGNLNHFIGNVLGNTGFVRKREAEFSDKNIPLSTINNQIDETIEMIAMVLKSLDDDQLKAYFPIEVFGQPIKTEAFLIHLYGHLNYHLGQVNYHRRILDV